jgi:hypothetical protein
LIGNAKPLIFIYQEICHILKVYVRQSRISVETDSDDLIPATNEKGQSWTEQIAA